MKKTSSELKDAIAEQGAKFVKEGCNREIYLSIEEGSLRPSIESMNGKGFTLISMFCEQNFNKKSPFTIFYVFEKLPYNEIIVVTLDLKLNHAASVSDILSSASWYEREITDGFGITFDGNPDKRRLFLHEIYPDDFHPLLKSFKNKKISIKKKIGEEYAFKKIEGEGVYQIPVGPVHAGIIEPGHFRFSVIGETIYNLEIRMFFKHRGIEKLAEGKKPQDCINIAESVSGDESVANAVAFCTAVEKISKTSVPKRALQLRAIFMEIERIYSHLSDMAGMIIDVAYAMGASPFFILREEIFRKNEQLTGSRFIKGALAVGGLTKDISNESLEELNIFLNHFSADFEKAANSVYSSPSVIDRFETTGIIKSELVKPLNITGPAARACGFERDTRIDHPYGIYNEHNVSLKKSEKGDVLSRFNVKFMEVKESIRIIGRIINNISGGKIISQFTPADGFAISLVEAPRGQSVHWVDIRNGIIYRYKVRTASFCNWQAIEHAVLGNIVPDFPLINKSLNLSYAGTDM